MRIIAIGDIHGCYKELEELITSLEQNGKYNKNTDKIVFLGDYIDRGENSRLVIELIRNLQKENPNVIALMGNHESMLLDYYNGLDNSWTFNGHTETIESYKGFEKQFTSDLEWMENLPLYHEDEHFVFVHAGIDANKTMEQQKKYNLIWVRESFIYNNQKYCKQVIFGHTPTLCLNQTDKPAYTSANNIAIDTGCVFGGALTALILEDGKVTGFYQVESKDKKIFDDEEEQYNEEEQYYYDEGDVFYDGEELKEFWC